MCVVVAGVGGLWLACRWIGGSQTPLFASPLVVLPCNVGSFRVIPLLRPYPNLIAKKKLTFVDISIIVLSASSTWNCHDRVASNGEGTVKPRAARPMMCEA